MNLFEFIINPESYTQTIENIFYTSFLIKERRAAIDYDDDGEPIICESRSTVSRLADLQWRLRTTFIDASLPPDDEQKAEAEIKARQLIFEMDMQMWKVGLLCAIAK